MHTGVPRGQRIWRIIDLGMVMYQRNMGPLLGVSTAIMVPAQVIWVAAALPLISRERSTVGDAHTHALVVAAAVSLVIQLVAGVLLAAANVSVGTDSYFERTANVGVALRRAIGPFFALTALTVLYAIGVGVGCLAFLIPGIWFAVAGYVAIPAILIERLTPIAALRRSIELVRDNWWVIAAVLVVVGICGALAQFAIGQVPGVDNSDHATISWQAAIVITGVAFALEGIALQPFLVCVQTAAYYDLTTGGQRPVSPEAEIDPSVFAPPASPEGDLLPEPEPLRQPEPELVQQAHAAYGQAYAQSVRQDGSNRAGFSIRFVAALIDVLLLSVVSIGVAATGASLATWAFVTVATNGLYYTLMEGSSHGQTLGKMAAGIRVVSLVDGGPIGHNRALVRWLGRIVSGIALFAGYLWMLADPQRQTWHDKLAGSVVIPVHDQQR